MARFRFNRRFNVNRVVKRLVRSILALYVGGMIMTTFGQVMANTSSPFYTGLQLVGWTVGSRMFNTTHYCVSCTGTCVADGTTPLNTNLNCLTDTSGSGVLAVVGIITIAQVIMEFISW